MVSSGELAWVELVSFARRCSAITHIRANFSLKCSRNKVFPRRALHGRSPARTHLLRTARPEMRSISNTGWFIDMGFCLQEEVRCRARAKTYHELRPALTSPNRWQ